MTVVEQLEALQAETNMLKASIETANAEKLATEAKFAELQASVKTVADEKAALVEAHDKAISEINAKVSEQVEQLKAANEAIAERDKKLSDPAYKLASASGDATPVPEGGAAKNDGDKSLVQKLADIKDPVARAAFYHANKEAIKAELK
jgi:chromosome segregation ATPase